MSETAEPYAPTVTVSAEAQSSVEFTSSVKGVVSPTVKVYHADPEQALEIAKTLYTKALEYAREKGAQP